MCVCVDAFVNPNILRMRTVKIIVFVCLGVRSTILVRNPRGRYSHESEAIEKPTVTIATMGKGTAHTRHTHTSTACAAVVFTLVCCVSIHTKVKIRNMLYSYTMYNIKRAQCVLCTYKNINNMKTVCVCVCVQLMYE